MFIVGSYITILDVFGTHRNYMLGPEVMANMFLHHILIIYIMLGGFLRSWIGTRVHLVLCILIMSMWFKNHGCIMSHWQKEDIPYTSWDLECIHGSYEESRNTHLFIMLPVIAYDFYKILQ
jgi:hypothetical protein